MSTMTMTAPETARVGRTPTVVKVLVAATFAVLLNETQPDARAGAETLAFQVQVKASMARISVSPCVGRKS